MSKDEFLKIQTCVLKVNIHCDGCKHKVKKILQKIEGVYTTKIDSDQGKVTVSGNVDSAKLIKKLIKNGKHAELWGVPKSNNQLNNLKIDNKKGGGNNNNKGQAQKSGNGGNNNNQPKGGGGGGGQSQQLPQMKGLQDLKLPPQFMKDMKLPFNNNNQKSVKFKLPEDEDLSDYDDDCDDFDDDDDDEDYEFDDDVDDVPLSNKGKPMLGNNGHGHGGGPKMPNMMMMNNLLNAGNNNGKKGIDGNIQNQTNVKKGGNHGNNNNNGGGNSKGGKSGGEGKNNGGGKKTNDGPKGMIPENMMMAMNRQKGNFAAQMGHMGNNPLQAGNMDHNLRAVQGLPASALPEQMANNSYQQQLAAMMMNQQRANGNERFQPMMYARPPPSVSYMPPYPPHPYPYYPPPPGERVDQYSMFSDEDTTSSCAVM